MLDLIEIELTRVRKMAEHADDGFLLYLLDMAILEANSRARSMAERRVNGEGDRSPESGAGAAARNLVEEHKAFR